MPGPKPRIKHFELRDKTLIHLFLSQHLDRAEKGIATAMEMVKQQPANQQFAGMVEYFTGLVKLLNSLLESVHHKQPWLYRLPEIVAQMEAQECQPPT